MGRKILLISLILLLVAGTSYAGSLLTEDEMDRVNAKGLQIITNDNEQFAPIADQENNLDSVQLNDYSQEYAKAYTIVNSAKSAVNSSANILYDGDNGNGGSPDKSFSGSLTQENINTAINHRNKAYAGNFAIAANINKERQIIKNGIVSGDSGEKGGVIEDQDNNNNSVQLNDYAQWSARALSIMNIAQSAANTSINTVTVNGKTSGSTISQYNDNTAINHVNEAYAGYLAIAANVNKETQNVLNMEGTYSGDLGEIEDQDNNNNSVQVNNNAQRYVNALILENLALSASNNALNIIASKDVSGSTLTQENYQDAYNFDNTAVAGSFAVAGNGEITDDPGQYIHNVHATINDQDNNNNSVQLNESAQQSINAYETINAANSAVNKALNIMYLGDVNGSTLRQINNQFASNHNNLAIAAEEEGIAIAGNLNKQTQIVENCFCSDLSEGSQDNNMNSVQLNDYAQQNAKSMFLMNMAESAVNASLNLITAGVISGSAVTQSNTNTAINFSNVANGGSEAYAINREMPREMPRF